jgi:hypothetical protein
MKLKLFAYFTLIILASCRVTKNSVCGVYVFRDKHNPEFTEAVHLYQDGTFNYQFSDSFVPYPRLKGLWQLTDHSVILNSSNISVFDKDTLKLTNIVYKVKWGNLKGYVEKLHRHYTLKKVHKHFKTFILNYETF